MIKKAAVQLLVFGCVMAAPLSASAAKVFVDGATGDDTNSGSQGQPLATIQAALDAAAASPGADAVIVAPGTYEENVEIYDLDAISVVGWGGVTIASPDPDEDVMKIDSGDVLLRNIDLSGGDDGIDAENDDGTLTRLRLHNVNVSDNGDRGLEVDDVDTVEILGGSYNDNGDDGIKVDVPLSFRASFVDVSGNGSDGFDLADAVDIRIISVQANDNGDEGLEVDDSDTIRVTGSTFDRNFDDGLDLDDVRFIVVSGSRGRDNGDVDAGDGAGIQIVAQDDQDLEYALIRFCDFSGNGADGMQVFEDDGGIIENMKVKNTSATNNGQSGFDIVISGTLLESNNNSSGNGLPDTW